MRSNATDYANIWTVHSEGDYCQQNGHGIGTSEHPVTKLNKKSIHVGI